MKKLRQIVELTSKPWKKTSSGAGDPPPPDERGDDDFDRHLSDFPGAHQYINGFHEAVHGYGVDDHEILPHEVPAYERIEKSVKRIRGDGHPGDSAKYDKGVAHGLRWMNIRGKDHGPWTPHIPEDLWNKRYAIRRLGGI